MAVRGGVAVSGGMAVVELISPELHKGQILRCIWDFGVVSTRFNTLSIP